MNRIIYIYYSIVGASACQLFTGNFYTVFGIQVEVLFHFNEYSTSYLSSASQCKFNNSYSLLLKARKSVNGCYLCSLDFIR